MKKVIRAAVFATAAIVLLGVAAYPQQGPKKETGDPVARPRPRPGEAPPAAEQPKIPSQMRKAEQGQADPQAPTFRADTLSVTVDVGVLDNRGRFIPGIPPGNFRILEDGVPQKVTGFNTGESPMTIAMVIEFSNLFQQYWSWGWQETLTACTAFSKR